MTIQSLKMTNLFVIPAEAGIQDFGCKTFSSIDSRWSLPRTPMRGGNDTGVLILHLRLSFSTLRFTF